MTTTEKLLFDALVETTAALKDIINAAGNDQPYNKDELYREFSPIYNMGYETLLSQNPEYIEPN